MNYLAPNEFWVILDRLSDVILFNIEGCVVEIGIGSSSVVLAKHAKEYGRKIYACDRSLKRCEDLRNKIDCDGLIVVNKNSYSFMDDFNDNPAIVFLDGNHHCSTVIKEISFFLEKLSTNGVIFVHDTTPLIKTYERKDSAGKTINSHLSRCVFECRRDVDVLTWRYTAAGCGLTMIYKKDMSGPFYRT